MKHKLLIVMFLFTCLFVFSQQKIPSKKVIKQRAETSQTFIDLVNNNRKFGPNGLVRCASFEYNKSKQIKGTMPSDADFEKWLAPKLADIKKKRIAGRLPSVIKIPVVVHVIHNGDLLGSGENIPDGQVLSQITVFNQDYRKIAGSPGDGAGVDTTIEFCLAQVDPDGNPTNGIDRRNLGIASFNGAAVETAKTNTIWDPTKYLNMWTFRFTGDLNGVLGYAQFPSGSGLDGMPAADCITGEATTDGVVCAFNTWGSRAIFPGGNYNGVQYDKGRTMTHEVGHMFGLRHTWGDGDCSVDDFCADTPNCDSDYYSGDNVGGCIAPTQCGNTRQIQNYMDYSDDGCMNIFTQNQKDRMLAVLMNSPRRDDLLISTVCNAPQASIQFKSLACESRIKNFDVNEGTGCVFTDYTIPLSIDKAPSADALVTFSIDGTSVANTNDISIQTPTLLFNSGATADKNLVIRVYNDAYVEANEDVVISFTVNANGGDALANSEGSLMKFTIKNDDIIPTLTVINTLIDEDFEDIPDWSLYDINSDTWGTVTGAEGTGTAPNTIVGACAYSEKSRTFLQGAGSGNATPNNYLISPQVTIPTGSLAITLEYIMAGFGANAGNYTVYFATNITSDATINTGTVLQASSTIAAGASIKRTHSLLALAGQTGYIVFRHSNNNGATGLLLLDNVKLTSTVTTNIQTTNNTATSGTNNLRGAGVNAGFFDSSSKNVMANVSVNDASNYGCATIAVTRDQATVGAFAAQYGSSILPIDFAMAKRFTITPTTVVSAGASTIAFYFTEAEVAGWEAFTGNNRSLLYVVKDNGSKEISPLTIGAFGTGVTLTATFATGIDGVYTFARQASLPAESFEFTDFSLYPNPNNGTFSIQFTPSSDNVGVVVHDMRGRVIYSKNYQNKGLFNESIQLDNVQSGIYLVTVQDGSKKLTKKIIIN